MPYGQTSFRPETEMEQLRCVISDEGDFLFVSPALGWALGQNFSHFFGRPSAQVLSVEGVTNVSELKPGFYEVVIARGERDPLLLSSWIDRVRLTPERSVTVVWLDPDNRLRQRRIGDLEAAAHEFASSVQDIQRRAQTASAGAAPDLGQISQTDGELRHFLNVSNDLLGVYRRDMSFVRVNATFNRVLGFTDADLKRFPFIDLIYPDERDVVLQKLQTMLEAPLDKESRVDFESRALCKDGSYRWMQWVHKAVGDHIYVVGHDVTRLKLHEESLLRHEQQLLEAQKIGKMGHWYWRAKSNAMEWSDQIFTIFGVEKGSFLPTMDNVNTLILKRDLGRIYRVFRRAMLRKKDYEVEFRLRRPGGSVRYIRSEGRCKVDARTGQVEAFFGIMQDITERTLHERQLRAAKEQAENAYASKTRFLANMSHELRTPLNAIIGFSEMMQRQLLGPVGNARYLDYIAGIRESGEHLLDLINDILDMSKIEVGKYELYVEELNVGKIVRLALHMIEGRAHEGQVRVVADDIPEDIHISADRRAIMQVLLNILSNAVKFTRPGGVVEVRCMRELGGVAIIISDTGIGIPKDKIETVTLPFEQVDSEFTRGHEGSGLGLAITKDLVNLHGGTMEIDSVLGVGTTVTVMLPDGPQLRDKTNNVF